MNPDPCPSELLWMKHYVDAKFQAQDRATDLALDTLNMRLEGMNEFRAQINNERGSYATQEKLDLIVESLRKEIRLLTDRRQFVAGRDWTIGVMAAILGAVIGVVVKVLT